MDVIVNVTYNDEQDEVNEVVKGVGVHYIIHDLHPALQSDHLGANIKNISMLMTGNWTKAEK